jgi:hypothetical protein
MSALLLAGTTSFVSCKDNVDDVETGIRMDMGTMNTQITNLEQRIATLEQNQVDVTSLKNELEALKTKVNELSTSKADKTYVDEEIKKLQEQINTLAELIKKTSSTMVTGVVLQETLDCVVGTINLPGFNPAFLAAYVGENKTGVPELPISGADYNVDPDGNYLKASELPTDEDMFVGNSGKNSYLINGVGNAGTLYFTINPRKVDPTLLQFSLINSTGEESPIGLSEVKKSDHLITFAIGKHGNGLTREDGAEDPLIAPTPTNVENDKTYLYEAKATVALDGIEKIHFDWTKFGYENKWDAGSALLGTNQGADAEAQNMFGRFQYLAQQVKAKNVKNVLEASVKILQDFYNGVYNQRNKLQKQALRVSWDDGENDVISGFDITTVTINPLNYKQMWLADQLLSGATWNVAGVDKIIAKLVSAVQSKMPTVNNISISVGSLGTKPTVSPITVNGQTVYLVVSTTSGKTWAYVPSSTAPSTGQFYEYNTSTSTVDWTKEATTTDLNISTDAQTELTAFVQKIVDEVWSGLDTSSLTSSINSANSQINSLINKYNSIKNADASSAANKLMTRVNNYLNKVTQKLMGEFDNQPCWKLTEPTLLFESNEGINRMYPFTDADGSMKFAAGKYNFIMTSMTEEYIVPVYRKYIALIYGGKVKFAQSFAGNQKIVQIEIPNEACEIVYQTCDYYGNVVTKRYPINRK